jgi:hypothetical protein
MGFAAPDAAAAMAMIARDAIELRRVVRKERIVGIGGDVGGWRVGNLPSPFFGFWSTGGET